MSTPAGMSRRKNVDSAGVNPDPDEHESESLLPKPAVAKMEESDPSVRTFVTRWACGILSFVAVMWVIIAAINLIRNVFPETDLVLNSKCSAPMQNWDGKLLNVPVWWSSYTDRPTYYNLHNERDYVGNDTNHHIHLKNDAGAKRPVIIFGTHHKTGTFLAKKLFSRICSKMDWCCLFHVTRDSVHALSAALQNEPVNAVGHNQWIWNPNALDIANYRFVHFYRHPFKKVISGYRYHADGTEEWTQKPLTYHKICDSPLTAGQEKEGQPASAAHVWRLCESIHLCETCCRMEHEREVPTAGGASKVQTVRRSAAEYQFLCDRLGRGKEINDRAFEAQLQHPAGLKHFHHTPTPSIQEMLLMQSARDGVLTEAALDYYENLRMARIINETAGDPHTLNIDLDDLNENFSAVTLRLLKFLEGIIPGRRMRELHHDLQFYDLQTSPIYRWSMANPIINHVTGTQGAKKGKAPPSSGAGSSGTLPATPFLRSPAGNLTSASSNTAPASADSLPSEQTASSTYLMGVLRDDAQVMQAYAPIFEMMKSVLQPSQPKQPAAHQ